MRIIVFGATGGVGQSVVDQGLENGLKITAFVRTPEKLKTSHENLNIIQGDAFNEAEVSAAIDGHDVVISCLGSNQGRKKSTDLQRMTKNIANGMDLHGVNRIIYTASAGVHKELKGISGKIAMRLLKNPLLDHSAAIEHIFTHGFNYTIVRPMGLTNKPFTGEYRESETGIPEKSSTIPRPDVAHFILKAVSDTKYDNASIGIAS